MTLRSWSYTFRSTGPTTTTGIAGVVEDSRSRPSTASAVGVSSAASTTRIAASTDTSLSRAAWKSKRRYSLSARDGTRLRSTS